MVPEPSPDGDLSPPDDDPEAVFLAHLDTVDRIVGALAARYAMSPDEHDDFKGWVRMKLVEDGYAVIRKHEGRSSMSTYLSVVIANLLRDRRIQKWGKWRPSAAARRAGPLGVQLERLLRRDGVAFDVAVRILGSRNGEELDQRALARLAATFPERTRPRVDANPDAVLRAVGTQSAEERVVADEQSQHESALLAALDGSLDTLDDEDRVILKLRFWEGLTVADISRALHLEQRPLYRRVNGLLARLRTTLEGAGVTGSDVGEMLGEEAR